MKFLTDLFSKASPSDSPDSKIFQPFQQHVAWAYEKIYSKPYPQCFVDEQGIARRYHGIQHVTRAAIYAVAWINLYRRHGDPEALALTDEDVRLIQIALIFHDSARLDEGVDKWDKESGALLYDYLTRVLGVDEKKALKLQDAVANKEKIPPNIYQKIIHDADCLDIIRARPHFDANYLHFYQQIACKNDVAFDEMAQLIIDARSLIEIQGDSFGRIKGAVKKKYENAKAYNNIMSDIVGKPESLLAQLAILLPREALKMPPAIVDQKQEIKIFDPDKIKMMMRQGLVLGRSIVESNAISKKPGKPDAKIESRAAKEFRKAARRKGVATRTQKKDESGEPLNLTKEGNPNRSTTLLGWGAPVFASVGVIIFNVDLNAVHEGRSQDYDTGHGKKKKEVGYVYSIEEKKRILLEISNKQKMGGDSKIADGTILNHNEVLYHVTRFDAIYYSLDPNSYNHFFHGNFEPYNPNLPVLQAIFIRNEYEKINGIRLPIFEYSGIHDYLVKREFDEKEIPLMWVELCSAFINNRLKINDMNVVELSIDQLKIASMRPRKCYEYISLDSNYPEELQKEITRQLTIIKNKKIKDLTQEIIQNPSLLKKYKYPKTILQNDAIKPLVDQWFKNLEKYLDFDFLWLKNLSSLDLMLYAKPGYIKNKYFDQNILKLFDFAKSRDIFKIINNIQERMRHALAKSKKNVFVWIIINDYFELKEEKTISIMANYFFDTNLQQFASEKIVNLSLLKDLINSLKIFKKFEINIKKNLILQLNNSQEKIMDSLENYNLLFIMKYLDILVHAYGKENLKDKEKICTAIKKQLILQSGDAKQIRDSLQIKKNSKLINQLAIQIKDLSLLKEDDDLFIKIIETMLLLNNDGKINEIDYLKNLKIIFLFFLTSISAQNQFLRSRIQMNIYNKLYSLLNPFDKSEILLHLIRYIFQDFREIMDEDFLLKIILLLIENKFFNYYQLTQLQPWVPESIFKKISLITLINGDQYQKALNLLMSISQDCLRDVTKKFDKLPENWSLVFNENMIFLFYLINGLATVPASIPSASSKESAIKKLVSYIQEEKSDFKIGQALYHFRHFPILAAQQGIDPDYATYDPKSP